MTDFRALCAELVDDLELCDWPYKLKETIRADIDRARAALADEPAVPEGREPASVTGQPSDEKLLETLDKATATFPPRHPEAEGLNAVEYHLALELRKARAVLTRWGNPAPQPPAEGEVAELVAELRMMASQAAEACQFTDAESLSRAAELLQQKPRLDYDRVQEIATEAQIRSAAQYLIKKQHCDGDLIPAIKYAIARWGKPAPQPVPVSERPWEREGWCAEDGRCWVWNRGSCAWWELVDSKLISYSSEDYTHCLPAHDLPIPHQQETAND